MLYPACGRQHSEILTVIVSYGLAQLPLILAALSVLWATQAAAAYVMFVGGTIISVEGREIVFRPEGGPDINKELGDMVKVRLKGDEKIWVGSRLNPSDLKNGEGIIVRAPSDKTGRLSLSDEAHALHAQNIEIPSYKSWSPTASDGWARRMSDGTSPHTLLISGPISSVTKTGESYLLTIPTDINCPGCVQFVEVDSATSVVTYARGDVTALKPGLEISLAPLSKEKEDDGFWKSRTLLVGNGIIKFK
jgi:hypothetical protein